MCRLYCYCTIYFIILFDLGDATLFVFGHASPLQFQLCHLCLTCITTSRLYEKLVKLAEKGHQRAQEKVAYALLFGDYMSQNVTKAREMFEKLAVDGSPKAQMVSSWCHVNLSSLI